GAGPRSRSLPSRLRSRAARSSSPPWDRRWTVLGLPRPEGRAARPSWENKRAPPRPVIRRQTPATPPRPPRRGRGRVARAAAAGGSRGFGRCGSLGGFLGLRFALLARDRAGWIVAFLALHHAGLVEEAQHPVGRQRALGEPSLDLVEIELEALGLVLRQQRVEITEAL